MSQFSSAPPSERRGGRSLRADDNAAQFGREFTRLGTESEVMERGFTNG